MKKLFDLKITRLAAIVIGGYIIVTTVRNIANLWSARSRITQAQEKLADLQAQNIKLNQEIAQAGNPTFIEREARDKLGFVKEGEVILVLPQDEVNKIAQGLRADSAKSAEPATEIPTWRLWLKLFTD